MKPHTKTFGETVREHRIEKQVSLRRFAKQVDMSPTYLSKVERGEFPPPAEEKVLSIAKALDLDQDELLALANRVASDINQIIKDKPKQMATFLRTAKGLSPEALEKLIKRAKKLKDSP